MQVYPILLLAHGRHSYRALRSPSSAILAYQPFSWRMLSSQEGPASANKCGPYNAQAITTASALAQLWH